MLGIAVAAALWWLYFDVVALVAERRLSAGRGARAKRDRTRLLFVPALPDGRRIVLVALGLKKTLGDVEEPLKTVPAVAMLGGTALYLLAHIAFRLRNVHTLNTNGSACCAVLLVVASLAMPRWRAASARGDARHRDQGGGGASMLAGRLIAPTRAVADRSW